ncbi:MAG: hypothetical protein AAFY80_11495 [Pseudomonadota bacterium]
MGKQVHRAFVVGCIAYVLVTGPAVAWFFQPPPEVVSEEDLSSFSEASSSALIAISDIFRAFSAMESEEVAISEIDDLSDTVGLLEQAVLSFSELQGSSLSDLVLSAEALGATSEGSPGFFDENDIFTFEDVALRSASICQSILDDLNALVEIGFGPSDASDPFARGRVNSISQSADLLIFVINTASGAAALEFQ